MEGIRLFEVGGHIRDHLMGLSSKDIDYAVEAESYEAMDKWITETHEKVFLRTPDKYTIRALIKSGKGKTAYECHRDNLVRDYVLCRKEGPYSDGRRPDWVEAGTFKDDIMRRDFTINALAREVGTDEIIDLVGGVEDIKNRKLRAVGSAHERFQEDSLRVIRAIRFIVTKGFMPDRDIEEILLSGEFADRLSTVSSNRRREEMLKCMRYFTPAMIHYLGSIHPHYSDAIFQDGLWLMPTLKDK